MKATPQTERKLTAQITHLFQKLVGRSQPISRRASSQTGLSHAVVSQAILNHSSSNRRFRLPRMASAISLALLFLASFTVASAQLSPIPGISTFAGTPGQSGNSGDGGPATAATFVQPTYAVIDHAGDIYIADTGNNNVRMIAASTGIITTVAGNGTAGFSGDGGPATNAELNKPGALALDSAGNLYIADTANNRVRVVNVNTGLIATAAGTGSHTSSGDGGAATSAGLTPAGIAIDSAGNIFVTDFAEPGIREINGLTGIITTVLSNSSTPSPSFQQIYGLTVASTGYLYLADADNHRVLQVNPIAASFTVAAGNGTSGSSGDGGAATSAELNFPLAVAFDAAGNLYISDADADNIRKVSALSGTISTVAGSGTPGDSGDGGPAINAQLNSPNGIAFDSAGNLYIPDIRNSLVRKVSPVTFPATNVGSSSTPQNLFLQTTSAESISGFSVPPSQGNQKEYAVGAVTGCVVDGATSNPAGTICTVPITFSPAYPGQRNVPLQATTSAGNADISLTATGIAPIAAITPGAMSTIAGDVNASNCNAYSAPALAGPLCNPSGGVVDYAGNVYVASYFSNTISKTDTTGNTTVIAGTGSGTLSGIGGPATSASFDRPSDVVVDSSGNVYFASDAANQVFKIDAVTQVLSSIAGTGTAGYSGDFGPATQANLNAPEGLALDSQGNLYIEDQYNNLIRKVSTAGVITTVAGNTASVGNSTPSYGGDGGPATQANLALCCGGVDAAYDDITVDANGNLFIGDSGHHVVREVTTDGIIHTIAGNNSLGAGFSGDGGAATSAQLNWPMGVAVDAAGDLYIADFANNLIRKVDAASHTIMTVAGNTTASSATSGPATQVNLNGPQKVALDGLGNLYVFDTKSNLIREVNISNATVTFPTSTTVGSIDTTDGPLGVVMSNIGNAALTSPTTVTNPAISAGFSLFTSENGACDSTTLAIGSSCVLDVEFTPVSAGNITGTMVLTDNSLNATSPYATQTINLAGVATTPPGPVPVLTPASLSFGNVAVGSTSTAQMATLSNTGGAPQGISSFGFFGPNASSFTQTNNCGTSVAAGASCTISISCAPSATGALSANLGVNFPSPEPQLSVALTCTGTAAPAPQAALTPATANFGSITVGTTSSAQTFTLTNAGNAALPISSIAFSGSGAGSYAITSGNCSTSLAASNSCTINVTFDATTVGTLTATLNVIDSLGTQSSTLTGVGTAAPAPQAALTPATANFGSITTGTTSATQAFTLTNAGNASLSITSVALGGTNASVFTIATNTCGSSLAAGASCAISVTFTPTATGTQTATLSVIDAVGTQTSSLTGTGSAPAVAADFAITTTPASQTVKPGINAIYTVSVASVGGAFSNPVALSATGLPAGATVSFSPASVTPGASSANATMTIQTSTNVQTAANSITPANWKQAALAALLPFSLLLLRKRRRLLYCLLVLAGIGTLGSLTGCSGGFAYPAKTYTITITGTGDSSTATNTSTRAHINATNDSGVITHSTTVTLTIQ